MYIYIYIYMYVHILYVYMYIFTCGAMFEHVKHRAVEAQADSTAPAARP